MSLHNIPLTDMELAGLVAHGLDVGTPSQLSDAFRHGIAFASKQLAAKNKELLDEVEQLTALKDAFGEELYGFQERFGEDVGITQEVSDMWDNKYVLRKTFNEQQAKVAELIYAASTYIEMQSPHAWGSSENKLDALHELQAAISAFDVEK